MQMTSSILPPERTTVPSLDSAAAELLRIAVDAYVLLYDGQSEAVRVVESLRSDVPASSPRLVMATASVTGAPWLSTMTVLFAILGATVMSYVYKLLDPSLPVTSVACHPSVPVFKAVARVEPEFVQPTPDSKSITCLLLGLPPTMTASSSDHRSMIGLDVGGAPSDSYARTE